MAIELAVFLRGEVAAVTGGDVTVSLSLCVEFRDSQENGPVIFREGGGGATTGAGDGVGFGLVFGGESGLGDHGIAGNEAVILLRESFFEGCFSGTGGGSSECLSAGEVKVPTE